MHPITESTIESSDLARLGHRRACNQRGVPWPAIEWRSGDRCVVLNWLNARTEELRGRGHAVQRLRFRQHRRLCSGKITYNDVPVAVAHDFIAPHD